MKKNLSLFVAFVLFISFSSFSYANSDDELIIKSQINEISSSDKDFTDWQNADVCFVSVIYNNDSVFGNLYHIKNNNIYKGYVIVDSNNKITEFSVGIDPYSRYLKEIDRGNTKLMYTDGMPYIKKGDNVIKLSISGKELSEINLSSRVSGHLQDGNCMVGAISNLIWHNSINGYSDLTDTNYTFKKVRDEIDDIMLDYGGYANRYIPKTIRKYTRDHTDYQVSVSNYWYPSFSDVRKETNKGYACLLGFAAGSPYSDDEGHMTVCIKTDMYSTGRFVKLLDGHSESPVWKEWGDYNDFYCKVRFYD